MSASTIQLGLDGSQTLRYARKLIKHGWIQHFMSEDKHGNEVWPWETTAVCWCATGAVDAVMPRPCADEDYDHVIKALYDVTNNDEPIPEGMDALSMVQHWNDQPERTKDEVLAAYDEAIELLEHWRK